MRGQEWLVLTRPGTAEHGRSQLVFPSGMGFLVMEGSEQGQVIAEVGPTDLGRALSVRSGRYFVRGRASDVLLEGTVVAVADESRTVEPETLQRVAYARLVRKGARDSGLAQSPQLGMAVRSRLPNSAEACWGPSIGYRLELTKVSFAGRLGMCTSRFDNSALSGRTNEYSLALTVERAWDFSYLSVSLAFGIGSALTTQSFETSGTAPTRYSESGFAVAGLGVRRELWRRWYIGVDAWTEAHLFNLQDSALVDPSLRLGLAVRGSAVLGVQY